MSRLPSPRSPSDSLPGSTSVEVGGRARPTIEGERRTIVLVDAYGELPTDLSADEVADGDLVVAEGTVEGGVLCGAVLREHHRPRGTTRRGGHDVARLLGAGVGRRLREREKVLAAVRDHFRREGFLEVDTPCLVPCPGLDTHLDAFAVTATSPPRFLATSPEYQMKRLLVGGIPRCFQIGRSFRRGEVGGRHNPEFAMLEWYRAFASVDAVMADTEAVVVAALEAVERPSGRPTLDVSRPFLRFSVREAFARFAGVDESALLEAASHDPDRFFLTLVDHVEPALAALGRPVFLERWPAPMASLARLCPDDERYAERFELYAAGLELCNGFGELTDPSEQRARFERDRLERTALGKEVYPIDEAFLAALDEGMPPAAGNALGLDRLVMLASGAERIEDVMAFAEGVLD